MIDKIRYRRAVLAGLSFLERHYDLRDLWCDFSTWGDTQIHAARLKMPSPEQGESTVWVTAYVAKCLFEAGLSTPSLSRAIKSTMESRQDDGGWGWGPPAPSDCDTTATCAILLLQAGLLGREQLQGLAKLILSHQKPDGGLSTFSDARTLRRGSVYRKIESDFVGWCSSHNSVTASALQAMIALQVSHDRIAGAYEFLRRTQRTDGLWTCYWWVAPHYPTFHVAKAIVAASVDPAIDMKRTIVTLLETQDQSGAWFNREVPCPFSTAMAIQTLTLFPGGEATAGRESLERGRRWLVQVQHEDGSWISSEPIMRIPHRDVLDPEHQSALKREEDKLKHDIHHVFTTASVCRALAVDPGDD